MHVYKNLQHMFYENVSLCPWTYGTWLHHTACVTEAEMHTARLEIARRSEELGIKRQHVHNINTLPLKQCELEIKVQNAVDAAVQRYHAAIDRDHRSTVLAQ